MSLPNSPLEDLYQARDALQSAAAGVRALPPGEPTELRTYDVAIAGVLDGLFALVDQLSETSSTDARSHSVRGALDRAITAAHDDTDPPDDGRFG